jgi:hypothetical protein
VTVYAETSALLRQSLPDIQVLSVDARLRENARILGFEVIPTDVEPSVA